MLSRYRYHYNVIMLYQDIIIIEAAITLSCYRDNMKILSVTMTTFSFYQDNDTMCQSFPQLLYFFLLFIHAIVLFKIKQK
jgi:hypothetical protein